MDEFLEVLRVRSVSHEGKDHWTAGDQFDVTDLHATHLLGRIADEPAGCLRMRFFGDVAELDRLLVRPHAGRQRLAFELVTFALQLVARKGYVKAIAHAHPGWEQFWLCLGARPISAMKKTMDVVPECTAFEFQLEPAAVVVEINGDLSEAAVQSATLAVSHMQPIEGLEDRYPVTVLNRGA